MKTYQLAFANQSEEETVKLNKTHKKQLFKIARMAAGNPHIEVACDAKTFIKWYIKTILNYGFKGKDRQFFFQYENKIQKILNK